MFLSFSLSAMSVLLRHLFASASAFALTKEFSITALTPRIPRSQLFRAEWNMRGYARDSFEVYWRDCVIVS